jgi:hypothetical protein
MSMEYCCKIFVIKIILTKFIAYFIASITVEKLVYLTTSSSVCIVKSHYKTEIFCDSSTFILVWTDVAEMLAILSKVNFCVKLNKYYRS